MEQDPRTYGRLGCWRIETWVITIVVLDFMTLDIIGGVLLLCAYCNRSSGCYIAYCVLLYVRMAFIGLVGFGWVALTLTDAGSDPSPDHGNVTWTDIASIACMLAVWLLCLAWKVAVARRAKKVAEVQSAAEVPYQAMPKLQQARAGSDDKANVPGSRTPPPSSSKDEAKCEPPVHYKVGTMRQALYLPNIGNDAA
ncbi:hypothetical protein AAVH_21827 [Aphelenchoides avenae]|nr:hypothetical protein AAVH_21827 [Aphelenchus avenae]